MVATNLRRALLAGVLLIACTATAAAAGPETSKCGWSADVRVCVSVPGTTLTGDVPVKVSLEGPRPFDVVFTWEDDDLLVDFQPPWEFVWPTSRYPNGSGRLGVSVKPSGGELGEAVLLRLTLDNPARAASPADWGSVFQPRQFSGDPVFAAVGDGGDGTKESAEVAQSIHDSNAGLLLFLGDIYERGTPAEWDYNYGRASFDDPAGGRNWGRLARYTKPTLGNHEAHHMDAWRDYWHQRPNWETFSWGGVRFLVLNSECTKVAHGCGPNSEQYRWAKKILETSPEECVVATWHRPLMGPIAYETMTDLWKLLAHNGGDLVLNGHQHDMQEYQPVNGMVQLISGGGGHIPHDDPMPWPGVWQASGVPGALYVRVSGSALHWEFRDTSGQVVTNPDGTPGTGSVSC